MLAPRALITAAIASAAALSLAGCGSNPSSEAASTTPVAPAPAAPNAAAPASTPTSCPVKGASAAAKLVRGAKPITLSGASCTYSNPATPKETVTLTFAAKADLTLAPGEKYPVIYTVFQKNYKKEPATHYHAIHGLGSDAYGVSQTKPFATTSASWIQDGNYFSIKHSYFKASERSRKTAAAAVTAAAKKIAAAN